MIIMSMIYAHKPFSSTEGFDVVTCADATECVLSIIRQIEAARVSLTDALNPV